ncbi:hypothetical protein BDV33DRAFT_69402 [Aspergillus novoparasiticus]|uniref:Uncharacterized protein n=1 Tax=Aspergillus novoparasiticus TaxID=986946 RepID=A0A5N6E888_9EURO|nr:hypothetical protein BDV33DRAFT_69402 [Aspergillus novoparasiticus]
MLEFKNSIGERLARRLNPSSKNHTLVQVQSEEHRNTDSGRENETLTAHYHEKDYNGGSTSQLWTPTVLRPWVFVAFATLFIAILIVVQVLYSVSIKNDGISASDAKYRYLWTYGPTAVLIIVAGVWGQVEYRTKQLMPWKLMGQTPRPASQSLLLDYVSDWNVVTLFRALKHCHWVVAIAVLGTLLLKLLTVASTGLFMLQNVHVSNVHTTLTTEATFSGTGYNSTNVDSNAALIVVGNKFLNLPYPAGTTDKYAFGPFHGSDTPSDSNTILSGTVDTFSTDLSCKVATVKNWTQGCETQHCEQTQFNLTLSTPECSQYQFNAFKRSTSAVGGWHANVFLERCASSNDDTNTDRVIFAAAHWLNDSAQVQSLVCEPTYTISPALVSLFKSNQSVTEINSTDKADTSNYTIPGVTAVDIVSGLLSSLTIADSSLGTLIELNDGLVANLADPNNSYLDSFYRIATVSSADNLEPLLDAANLEAISRPVYNAITAQVARQYLMTSANKPFSGVYSATTEKLLVRELSVRLMEAAVALLVLVAGAMCVWRPAKCTPRDPGTISGMATILARSPDLSNRLSGIKNRKDLKSSLAGGLFASENASIDGQRSFTIITKHDAKEDLRVAEASSQISWWKPLAMSLGWRILTLAVPLLVIAGLETTYQISQKRNGLADITSDGYIRYTWVYIPAFIMLLIQALFECSHFSTQVIQPYLELRRGGLTAQESLMDNYLSKLTMHALWSALIKRKYAIFTTALTMILAPCLTIAASGLYSTEAASYVRAVSILRNDSFNSTVKPQAYHPGQKGIGLTGALVVGANLSYPDWTYDEVVLPVLKESTLTDVKENTTYKPTNQSSTTDSIFELTYPGLRAGLNCTVLEASQILETTVYEGFSSMSVSLSLGGDCDITSRKVGNKTIKWYDMTLPVNGTTYNGTAFGTFQVTDIINTMPECPKMVGVYGAVSNPNSTDTDGIHGFTCFPYVDEIDVDTTFTVPGFKIQSAKPDESSSRRFADSLASQLDFDSFLPTSKTVTAYDGFDNVFVAMMQDQKTLTVTDLEQSDRVPVVINATQHLYRVLMAQSMNGNSRLPLEQDTKYQGTVVDPTRVRLKQSAVSTRILEGFLAAMALCIMVAFYLGRRTEVIPVNPCSIAGAATLLAGSEMLKPDVIPPGSEWCDDTELVKRGVFNGVMFGLGWWEGKRFAIDIGRPEE